MSYRGVLPSRRKLEAYIHRDRDDQLPQNDIELRRDCTLRDQMMTLGSAGRSI